MSNQSNEMEYSFDDSVNRDIDVPDAEALSGTSCNSEDPVVTTIGLLATDENEEQVQEVIEDLEGNGILRHLRAVDKYLKLGENRSLLNNRRFPDSEGNDLMCESAKHRDTLDLLCDIHDLQSSNEPVAAMTYFQDYNYAISHLDRAKYLLRQWLAQR
ncbi:uncharacterized protein FFNC_11610 [Fusarium fujikuroi]|nr:uncharacterized protein FFNC_11610 [Fusarium fujikuroi]SCV53900.1 uncharacterized protein FFFS_10993 [Fusarium fujikuroi]